MIDPIGAVPTFAVRLASLDPVPPLHLPLPPPAVDPTVQARFQAALRGDPELQASLPVTAAPAAAPSGEATPGARILDNLERLRDRAREITGRLDTLSFQPEISSRELLLIQMSIGQVTLGLQLAGQVASKLEQHLNTLLKSS